MAQYAVFLLVVGHAPLTLLALGPGVAALTQALVGLHTHPTVAAGWLTFGYGQKREKRRMVKSGRRGDDIRFTSGRACASHVY